ncbi:bromo adjacent homology domain-containing 1 protein [Anaeramoeba flamelloides]|uniref:Bromo adjacent homology domain-containing 1 protein n=1 Tax=Anaeramoeba flamelloides TaxID=1746091 RepID=A0AAV8ACC6_9EUKA|nr:bromo adjacent homology domain-containing 1 protein [Anaeramoeba flamelloides]
MNDPLISQFSDNSKPQQGLDIFQVNQIQSNNTPSTTDYSNNLETPISNTTKHKDFQQVNEEAITPFNPNLLGKQNQNVTASETFLSTNEIMTIKTPNSYINFDDPNEKLTTGVPFLSPVKQRSIEKATVSLSNGKRNANQMNNLLSQNSQNNDQNLNQDFMKTIEGSFIGFFGMSIDMDKEEEKEKKRNQSKNRPLHERKKENKIDFDRPTTQKNNSFMFASNLDKNFDPGNNKNSLNLNLQFRSNCNKNLDDKQEQMCTKIELNSKKQPNSKNRIIPDNKKINKQIGRQKNENTKSKKPKVVVNEIEKIEKDPKKSRRESKIRLKNEKKIKMKIEQKEKSKGKEKEKEKEKRKREKNKEKKKEKEKRKRKRKKKRERKRERKREKKEKKRERKKEKYREREKKKKKKDEKKKQKENDMDTEEGEMKREIERGINIHIKKIEVKKKSRSKQKPKKKQEKKKTKEKPAKEVSQIYQKKKKTHNIKEVNPTNSQFNRNSKSKLLSNLPDKNKLKTNKKLQNNDKKLRLHQRSGKIEINFNNEEKIDYDQKNIQIKKVYQSNPIQQKNNLNSILLKLIKNQNKKKNQNQNQNKNINGKEKIQALEKNTQTLVKILKSHKNSVWKQDVKPKWPEPRKPLQVINTIIFEIYSMAIDFRQERRWKIALAKILVYHAALVYNKRQKQMPHRLTSSIRNSLSGHENLDNNFENNFLDSKNKGDRWNLRQRKGINNKQKESFSPTFNQNHSNSESNKKEQVRSRFMFEDDLNIQKKKNHVGNILVDDYKDFFEEIDEDFKVDEKDLQEDEYDPDLDLVDENLKDEDEEIDYYKKFIKRKKKNQKRNNGIKMKHGIQNNHPSTYAPKGITFNDILSMEIDIPVVNDNEVECKFLKSLDNVLLYFFPNGSFPEQLKKIKEKQQSEAFFSLFYDHKQNTLDNKKNQFLNNFNNKKSIIKNLKKEINNEKKIINQIRLDNIKKRKKNKNYFNLKERQLNLKHNNTGNNNLNLPKSNTDNNVENKTIKRQQMNIEKIEDYNQTHLDKDHNVNRNAIKRKENKIKPNKKDDSSKNKELIKWVDSYVKKQKKLNTFEKKYLKNLESIFGTNRSLINFSLNQYSFGSTIKREKKDLDDHLQFKVPNCFEEDEKNEKEKFYNKKNKEKEEKYYLNEEDLVQFKNNIENWKLTSDLIENLTKSYQNKFVKLKKSNMRQFKDIPFEPNEKEFANLLKKQIPKSSSSFSSSSSSFSSSLPPTSSSTMIKNKDQYVNLDPNNHNFKQHLLKKQPSQIHSKYFLILQPLMVGFHLKVWFLCKDFVNLSEKIVSTPLNMLFNKKSNRIKNAIEKNNQPGIEPETSTILSLLSNPEDLRNPHILKFYLIIFFVKYCPDLKMQIIETSKKKHLSQKDQVEQIHNLIQNYGFEEKVIHQLNLQRQTLLHPFPSVSSMTKTSAIDNQRNKKNDSQNENERNYTKSSQASKSSKQPQNKKKLQINKDTINPKSSKTSTKVLKNIKANNRKKKSSKAIKIKKITIPPSKKIKSEKNNLSRKRTYNKRQPNVSQEKDSRINLKKRKTNKKYIRKNISQN